MTASLPPPCGRTGIEEVGRYGIEVRAARGRRRERDRRRRRARRHHRPHADPRHRHARRDARHRGLRRDLRHQRPHLPVLRRLGARATSGSRSTRAGEAAAHMGPLLRQWSTDVTQPSTSAPAEVTRFVSDDGRLTAIELAERRLDRARRAVLQRGDAPARDARGQLGCALTDTGFVESGRRGPPDERRRRLRRRQLRRPDAQRPDVDRRRRPRGRRDQRAPARAEPSRPPVMARSA